MACWIRLRLIIGAIRQKASQYAPAPPLEEIDMGNMKYTDKIYYKLMSSEPTKEMVGKYFDTYTIGMFMGIYREAFSAAPGQEITEEEREELLRLAEWLESLSFWLTWRTKPLMEYPTNQWATLLRKLAGGSDEI